MTSVMISPPNAILLVMDPSNADAVIPQSMNDEPVAATSSCVVVGTQAFVDGETAVSLCFEGEEPPRDLMRVFEGSVLTPRGKLAVLTSELVTILERDVAQGEVSISIWVDDLQNPARVIVRGQADSVAA